MQAVSKVQPLKCINRLKKPKDDIYLKYFHIYSFFSIMLFWEFLALKQKASIPLWEEKYGLE